MSQNVVYISNEYVSVVCADVKRDVIRIESCFRVPLNEGTMLNGIIIDDSSLKKSLKVLFDKGIRDVSLVVDSAKILAKTTSIPKMKEKEIIQFVKDELSSVDSHPNQDSVYDFAYLGPDEKVKGASQILCVGVERQFIDSYLDVFNSVGIKIVSIDYAVNVLISLVKELPSFIDKTYVISQIDGQNMVSVLFMNNEYSLTNRSRIFANKGTIDYENEIVGIVSQLRQFASSSSQEKPISDLYFFGLNIEEEATLFERISDAFGLKVNHLPKSKAIYVVDNSEFDINDYVYCIGYLIRK